MISPEKGVRIVHLKSKNTQGGRGEKEGTEILTGRMEKHTGGKGKSHNIPTENSRHRHKRLTHYSLSKSKNRGSYRGGCPPKIFDKTPPEEKVLNLQV